MKTALVSTAESTRERRTRHDLQSRTAASVNAPPIDATTRRRANGSSRATARGRVRCDARTLIRQ
jgi:hypothetical protein